MKHITCYLDFVSPYAWLAFAQLPEQLRGISCYVRYRPVLLGALLKQYANPGPAGIAPKRDWTYRHAQWLGHAQGTPLQMPQRHPFNPLPLLRLALECSDDGCINRFTAEAIFRHVWEGGADALAPGRLDALRAQLTAQLRTDDQAQERAKALLRSNTEAAVAAGLFGVPSFVVDEHVFFGLDGLPMLRACLQGDAWFEQGWDAAAGVESGLG
ncbi:MAG: 2-hydroxychromene-2-carboxylate isomerase [Comamonas sp.]|jgi:2-hydroxychromene-2-carboxylate isomerase|nr:2-hydroxychromene-2-carboxylate isomerase [Comamonas sp.]